MIQIRRKRLPVYPNLKKVSRFISLEETLETSSRATHDPLNNFIRQHHGLH